MCCLEIVATIGVRGAVLLSGYLWSSFEEPRPVFGFLVREEPARLPQPQRPGDSVALWYDTFKDG